jgi:ribulose-phosphate 3-epimerase
MQKHPLSEFKNNRLLVSPSVLACDFARLGAELEAAEEAEADMIHLDIMDGHFVPNITLGPPIVASMRKYTGLPFDVHLMLVHPDRYVEPFAKAGADHITFHIESECDPAAVIRQIHEQGCSAGITLKPGTPASALEPVLADVDMVLVMSVEPGFGGQKFQPEMLRKTSEIYAMLRKIGSHAHIEIDGGITHDNVREAASAGANVIVAGTAVFRAPEGIRAAVAELHEAQKSLPRPDSES